MGTYSSDSLFFGEQRMNELETRNKFHIGRSCSKESIQNILDLKTPAHIVHFYRNEQQRINTLCPIFVGALQKDYGCIFLSSESHSMSNLESTVKRQIGLNLNGSTEHDRIVSLTGEDLMVAITFAEAGNSKTAKEILEKEKYAASSQTKPIKMTLAIERLIERGCKKIITAGNMTWAKKLCKDVTNLFKYESQFNLHLFSFPSVIAICEYYIPQFSTQELLQALHAHPLVLYECVVYMNDWYIPPPVRARYNPR